MAKMLFNPRNGYIASAVTAAAAGLWLLAAMLFGDDIYQRMGSAMHALTLLSIFVCLAALAVAFLFRKMSRVRADLLSGRDVIAKWHVGETAWHQFAQEEHATDGDEKRSVLALIIFFAALSCGGLALANPNDAGLLALIAAGISAVMGFAYFMGRRVVWSQLDYRSGDIIVGRQGLMRDGVLHVWDLGLSWLEAPHIEEKPVPVLTVSYAYWARYGPQGVNVRLPFERSELSLVRETARTLEEIARGQEARNTHRSTTNVETRT